MLTTASPLAPAATIAAPIITLHLLHEQKPGKTGYVIDLRYPQLVGTGATKARINAVLRQDMTSAVSGFLHEIAHYGPPPAGFSGRSSLISAVTTNIASASLVGFTTAVYSFPAGAAHGVTATGTRTFDATTGRLIKLADLFRPGAGYLRFLSRESRALLPPVLGQLLNPSMLNPGTTPTAANFTGWGLTPFGLTITFSDYQVAAYAAGTPTILIPFSVIGGLARRGGPISLAEAHGPVHTPLLPAITPSITSECYATLAESNSAVPKPQRCANGAINVAAWNSFATAGLRVLSLGRQASSSAVRHAACLDYSTGEAPYERAAEALAAAYYGWHFATSPLKNFPAVCGAHPRR